VSDPSVTTLPSLYSNGSISAGAFFVNVQAAESVNAFFFDDILGSNYADINGMASYNATILTNGPTRDGLMVVAFEATGSVGLDGGATISFSIGGIAGAGYGNQGCSNLLINYCNGLPLTYPVTLGVPLDVSLSGFLDSTIDAEETDSFLANLSGSVSFSFFELDGTTPVGWTDMTSAPEPNAVWLSTLGIALLATRIKRKA
jgi:hypothetical protein